MYTSEEMVKKSLRVLTMSSSLMKSRIFTLRDVFGRSSLNSSAEPCLELLPLLNGQEDEDRKARHPPWSAYDW